MAELVSLIVVTFNNAAELPGFFAALRTTTYPAYELIVVDNASSDGSAELARAQWPEAQVIANRDNIGFGRACNQGAVAARGDYVLFLNADVRIEAPWLDLLLESVRAHPAVGLWCPTTLYPTQAPPVYSQERIDRVAAIPGCALLATRRAWEDLGGFDPAMFLYWEDTELCWRAWLLGWEVAADLGALVYHDRGASTGFRRWDAETTKNSLYTYLKLMPWAAVVRFWALTFARSIAKTALGRPEVWRGWAWNLRHLTTTLRARRALRPRLRGDQRRLQALIRAQTRKLAAERRRYRS